MKTNLQPDEALEQISYLKELANQSRLKIAIGYPYFYLWGAVWLLGYVGSILIPGKYLAMMWLTIIIIGIAGSTLIGYGIGKKAEPAPVLLKKLGWLSLLMWSVAGLAFLLTFRGDLNFNLINAYWPFQIGVIYLANSLFFGRQLAKVGWWLVLIAVVALFIPTPYLFIWLALAGGGGLIFTGYIFRKQVVKVG